MRATRSGPRVPSAFAALAVALVLLAPACLRDKDVCAVCQRPECRAMVFSIHLEDGKTVRTCCPRCGLHYIETAHPKVASLTARDFQTARSIDATTAIYVDGSDVTPCMPMGGQAPKDDYGGSPKPVYDRCTPSLIAFASREDARRFADEHGGMLRTFAEVRSQPQPSSRLPG